MTRKRFFQALTMMVALVMLFTGSAQAMRIQHNVTALNAHRNLTDNNSALTKNLEKLSSGYRINRADDDAAGLAISEQMLAQITGLKAAQEHTQDGVSLIQTAEGALTETHSMLNRMVELAMQSANGTYSEANHQNMMNELEDLPQQIQQIAGETEATNPDFRSGIFSSTVDDSTMVSGFAYGSNVMVLITSCANSGYVHSQLATDGSNAIIGSDDPRVILVAPNGDLGIVGAGEAFVGAFDGAGNPLGGWNLYTDGENLYAEPGTQLEITLEGETITTLTLSVGEDAQLSVREVQQPVSGNEMDAQASWVQVQATINTKASLRTDVGAMQNRLEHKISNLTTQTENITAAESRIRDVDMAEEMMAYSKNNILVQASQAMLAQANMVPQGVLQLLQ